MLSTHLTGGPGTTCHPLSSTVQAHDSAAPCSVTSASSGHIPKVLTPEGQTTTIGEHLLLKRLKEHTRKLWAENRPFGCQECHSVLHRGPAAPSSPLLLPLPHLTLPHPSTWPPLLTLLAAHSAEHTGYGGQTGNGAWAHLNPLPPLSAQVQASPQPTHSAQHSPGPFLL